MRLSDLIADAVPDTAAFKVCTRPDCSHGGRPQSLSNFYDRKSACKTCCRRIGNEAHAKRREFLRDSQYVIDREPGGYLEIAPWRTWIVQQIDISGGLRGGGLQLVACELNVAERSIARWLYESRHVLLDVVDRALCHRGTPWVLRDLYPSLYEFEDAA